MFSKIRNFLGVETEVYAKEREIGRVSFAIKRAMIFALFLVPINVLIWTFLSENSRVGERLFFAIIMSVLLAFSELTNLEFEYQKNNLRKSETRTK